MDLVGYRLDIMIAGVGVLHLAGAHFSVRKFDEIAGPRLDRSVLAALFVVTLP